MPHLLHLAAQFAAIEYIVVVITLAFDAPPIVVALLKWRELVRRHHALIVPSLLAALLLLPGLLLLALNLVIAGVSLCPFLPIGRKDFRQLWTP